MSMTWWMGLAAAAMLALGCAFFAVLGLSAGTAYGRNYHSLSNVQRLMARALFLGSALLAIATALLGIGFLVWTVRQWLA